MEPSIVLFDLGGVLMPFDPERRIAALTEFSEADPAEARAFFAFHGVQALFRKMDMGAAGLEEFAAAFGAFCGRTVSEAETKALILSVFDAPNWRLWQLAHDLRGRCAVGGFSDNPRFVAELFPDADILQPMIFSADLGAMKPSREAFQAVEVVLGLRPDEIALVDDGPANIIAARARGWTGWLYSGPDALEAELRLAELL
jgi:putative hydrolase of the HAD superfamily